MYDNIHLFGKQTTRIVMFDFPNSWVSIFPNMIKKG
jgi:hypothetical protein